MSISDNYVPLRQIGNGVTVDFSASWNMLAAAYALVYLEDAATGVQTAVTPGPGPTQYTLVFNASGFTVTFNTAPTSAYYVVIGRQVALDQTDPYKTSKGFQGDVVEASFDKLTAIAQDQADAILRALTFPLGSAASGAVPSPVGQAGRVFAINATEDGIEYAVPNTGAYLSVSPYMITVLPSADAPTARTALGAAASGANTDITSLSGLKSINDGQIAGFRNGFINGAMDVWQRGTSFTPIASTVTYTADRWCAKRDTSANYTVTQQAGTGGGKYCLRVQRTAASTETDNIYLGQSLENMNVTRYLGKKLTFRFKARAGANYSNAGGTLSARIQSGTTANQNTLNGLTGSVDDVTIAAALTTSWQTFTATSAAIIGTSVLSLGCLFVFTPVGTAGAADYFEVTDLEIIEGSTGDDYFERLDFATVIQQCNRYYEKSFAYATVPAQNIGTNTGEINAIAGKAATGVQQLFASFKARKRTSPTIILYNTSAANAQVRDIDAAADCSAAAVVASQNGFRVACNGNASTAVGNLLAVHYSADAEI